MLYRQKKDTYIRNYSGVGYITSTGLFNDRTVNESGTVFLCAIRDIVKCCGLKFGSA